MKFPRDDRLAVRHHLGCQHERKSSKFLLNDDAITLDGGFGTSQAECRIANHDAVPMAESAASPPFQHYLPRVTFSTAGFGTQNQNMVTGAHETGNSHLGKRRLGPQGGPGGGEFKPGLKILLVKQVENGAPEVDQQ